MRIFSILTKWVFMLCLPVLILTVSIVGVVNNLWLYEYGFDKYYVSNTTGLADTELEKTAAELVKYFNSGEEYIDLTVVRNVEQFRLFNQRELVHLRDVKQLIWLGYWVSLGTLIYVLGYSVGSLFWWRRRNWRSLAWEVVGGSVLTLIIILALGLGALFNFNQLFLQFHFLSFSNDFWQLDPAKDYLIRLFPQGFFYDATLFCALATAVLATILGSVAGGYLMFAKKSSILDNRCHNAK
ncbi:TIGR01906 family membrane protein [Chloroflexota bacterium]